MTVTIAQATTLLENVLFESSTLAAANAAQWVTTSETNLAAGTIDGLAEAMAAVPEAGIAEQVVRYYEGALGRDPSASEIAYYVKVAETGLSAGQITQGASAVPTSTWNQIAGYFAASQEYQSLTSGGNVIPALYQNILGRAPSADEVSFYQKALDGGTSVSTLLQYFVNSTEYQSKTNGGIAALLAADGQTAVNQLPSTAEPVVDSGGSVFGATSSGAGTSTISLAGTVTTLAAKATSAFATISGASLTSAALTTVTLSGAISPTTIASGPQSSVDDVIITAGNSASTTLDLSHLSGTSAPTYTLPTGTDDFSYDGTRFHIVVGSGTVQLIGVSASDITLLPAHC